MSRDILLAVLEQRRTGNAAAMETLESTEPDLAEYVLEELSQIHKDLLDSGAAAKRTRTLQRRIEALVIVAVLSLRQAHARLWQKEEPPHVAPVAEPGPSVTATATTGASDATRGTATPPSAAGTQPSTVRAATCPKCRSDRILYLENASLKRRVLGLYDDGRTCVHGFYVVLDELGEQPRFACESCDHEWPADLNHCEFF